MDRLMKKILFLNWVTYLVAGRQQAKTRTEFLSEWLHPSVCACLSFPFLFVFILVCRLVHSTAIKCDRSSALYFSGSIDRHCLFFVFMHESLCIEPMEHLLVWRELKPEAGVVHFIHHWLPLPSDSKHQRAEWLLTLSFSVVCKDLITIQRCKADMAA